MKQMLTTLWAVLFPACLFLSCLQPTTIGMASDRIAIDSILKIQEEAYDQNTEAGRKALAATCSDSLLFIGGDDGGLAQSADFYVHDLADGYSQKPSGKTYRIYSHTAIVTSTQQTFKIFGKDTIYFNSRTIKVFVKNQQQWKMAFVSYAPIPVFYHSKSKLDPALGIAYSGLYQSGPQSVDTVFYKDSTLYLAQASSTAAPLYPLKDSSFYGEGYFGKTGFLRNTAGQVTEMYFEFTDGQRLHFPRRQ